MGGCKAIRLRNFTVCASASLCTVATERSAAMNEVASAQSSGDLRVAGIVTARAENIWSRPNDGITSPSIRRVMSPRASDN